MGPGLAGGAVVVGKGEKRRVREWAPPEPDRTLPFTGPTIRQHSTRGAPFTSTYSFYFFSFFSTIKHEFSRCGRANSGVY